MDTNRFSEQAARERLVHPFPPTWNGQSRILILGSFPSVKSREMAFFYGHPQNRFWHVVSAVFSDAFPKTVEERRAFLLRHRIAAWDVIASCSIVGSSDSSIRDAVANDIRPILDGAEIRQIYVNGKTAFRLYEKYLLPLTGRDAVCLPSTSPANAAWSLERLIEAWSVIAEPAGEKN
ncbi:MAG: DNA-deoxyinosine glycosylase [Oscillospiraceae bacterium]|nr:DNA-deoxyinosine glycosylase [Oscillospiraceae bacterium]